VGISSSEEVLRTQKWIQEMGILEVTYGNPCSRTWLHLKGNFSLLVTPIEFPLVTMVR
jgi:hypothetical protein